MPIGELARRYPSVIEVLERLDIDYACFGGRSVADAAHATGEDPEDLIRELRAVAGERTAPDSSLPDIVHRIITEHHNIERDLMRDLLNELAVHENDRDAYRIRRILISLGALLFPHMRREERELFPLVEELALRPRSLRAGTVSRRLFAEFAEHATVHERLARIRELTLRLRTRGFTPTNILDALDALERLTHRHLHLENNVLMPGVVDLENRLRAERATVTA